MRGESSRGDYSLRMIQRFDRYLKGPGGAAPPYEVDYGIAKGEASAPR